MCLSISRIVFRTPKCYTVLATQDDCWSADFRFSNPKEKGSSCSKVMTTDLPSLSYISIGIFDCKSVSLIHTIKPFAWITSQNSLMNCRHMPQGDAGGVISVETAMARMSPLLAPYTLISMKT